VDHCEHDHGEELEKGEYISFVPHVALVFLLTGCSCSFGDSLEADGICGH
jgi:hypothetical protein